MNRRFVNNKIVLGGPLIPKGVIEVLDWLIPSSKWTDTRIDWLKFPSSPLATSGLLASWQTEQCFFGLFLPIHTRYVMAQMLTVVFSYHCCNIYSLWLTRWAEIKSRVGCRPFYSYLSSCLLVWICLCYHTIFLLFRWNYISKNKLV